MQTTDELLSQNSSKSGMRLEVLMENKISEKFVLTNEGSLCQPIGVFLVLSWVKQKKH
jgi:hypothetical protein